MPLYDFSNKGLTKIREASMSELKIRERQDLQDVLRENIGAVAPNVLVISEEYSGWEDSRRRIDLLGIDEDGSLVVIELKRTTDGGHMELQAIRYASMVAALNLSDVIEIFEAFLAKHGRSEDARDLIINHINCDESEAETIVADQVRIVLVSEGFGTEITTTALWLNEQGIDIRCVRLQPYSVESRVVFDIQQLIPLPEAGDLMVKKRQKEARQKAARTRGERDFTKYCVIANGEKFEGLNKRRAILAVVTELHRRGVSPTVMRDTIAQSRQRFYEVDGVIDSEDEFIDSAGLATEQNEGKVFDARRYFTAPEELLHFEGKTYAFSNQWGSRTEKKMNELIEAHGDSTVSFRREQ